MNRKVYQWALILTCSAVAACSSNKNTAQPVVYLEKKTISVEWMADKEALLLESIKGSPFTLHKQGNAWLVTAPAQQSFNADRPDLLLPAVLGPITRIAKMVSAHPDTAAVILGHTDINSNDLANHKLSTDRARAVASIFRLGGLTGRRLTHLGMGSSYSLHQQKSATQNHRVEIIIMPDVQMQDVLAQYRPTHTRLLALSEGK